MAVDTSAVVAQLLPPLVASSTVTMVWWTEDELYRYINDATNSLARACVLVGAETTIPSVAGQAAYSLPALCLGVMELASGPWCLPQTAAAGLDAIDPHWKSTEAAEATRYALDTDGPDKLRIYPTPSTAGVVNRLIYRARLADAAPLSPTLALPSCLSEYLWWATLAAAREKEGKGAMPDVSRLAEQITMLLGMAVLGLWGGD